MSLPIDKKKGTIIRTEEETDPNYGCKPEDRTPLKHYINNGVINLDKPSGPTSHEVVTWVKNILNVEKTGHAGTLDPKVTGVLPVAIGNATKLTNTLQKSPKEYVCICRFHKPVELNKIKRVFNIFTTTIWQRPPLISAVSRTLRTRRIYYIDLIEWKQPLALFRVGCQSGTYIRKLCYDFGEVLLCGANMEELRRTRTGSFDENHNLVTLQDLHDAMYLYNEEADERYLKKFIQPMENAIKHLDKIVIRDNAVDSICHGADLGINGVISFNDTIEKEGTVAIMTQKGELVAIGKALQNARKMVDLKSGLVVKTKRVFMERKTYPYFKKT